MCHPEFNVDHPTCSRFLPPYLTKKGKKITPFGQYRQFANESDMTKFILRFPEAQRTFLTVILPHKPVYIYFDFDMKRCKEDEHIEEMLEKARVALRFVQQVFEQTYPSVECPFDVDQLWWFQAISDEKWSFHVHTDPTLSPPVWSSIAELAYFMKDKVQNAIAEDFRNHGNSRLFCTAKEDGVSIDTCFMDFAPYGKMQNVKLPLNRKPGKVTMELLKIPSCLKRNVKMITSAEQIAIGRIVVVDPQVKPNLPSILPQSSSSIPVVSTKRTRQSTITPSFTLSSTPELNQTADGRRNIVLYHSRLLLGPDVSILTFEVNRDSIRVGFEKQTGVCPFENRVHASNRLTLSAIRTSSYLYVRCFDCKGKCHPIPLTSDEMAILFPKIEDVNGKALHAFHNQLTSVMQEDQMEFTLIQQLKYFSYQMLKEMYGLELTVTHPRMDAYFRLSGLQVTEDPDQKGFWLGKMKMKKKGKKRKQQQQTE